MDIILSAINVYPVKSLGGVQRERARVTSRGIEGDRRWMLTDPEGRFLSQRSHPALAVVSVAAEGKVLHLTTPGQDPLVLIPPTPGRRRQVTIWRDTVEATAGDDHAAGWFSRFLGQPCQLAYMDDGCHRPAKLPAGSPEHLVSFADGYPCLLTSTASLNQLNEKLDHPIGMDRFRSNLVVTGCGPHQEDTWKKIQIGDAIFQVIKPCSRCQIPTIDQETGLPSVDQEPLSTLATYRTQPGGVMFGMNLLVVQEGTLQIGDSLKVLS